MKGYKFQQLYANLTPSNNIFLANFPPLQDGDQIEALVIFGSLDANNASPAFAVNVSLVAGNQPPAAGIVASVPINSVAIMNAVPVRSLPSADNPATPSYLHAWRDNVPVWFVASPDTRHVFVAIESAAASRFTCFLHIRRPIED